MRRGALIAFLAVAAILALPALVTAHAHDGPVVVAALDTATPQLATAAVTTESGSYELAVLSAYLALPADMYSIRCDDTDSLERTERVDYMNASVTTRASDHAGNKNTPDQRARDVPGESARG